MLILMGYNLYNQQNADVADSHNKQIEKMWGLQDS